jgi:hypothetical protein
MDSTSLERLVIYLSFPCVHICDSHRVYEKGLVFFFSPVFLNKIQLIAAQQYKTGKQQCEPLLRNQVELHL